MLGPIKRERDKGRRHDRKIQARRAISEQVTKQLCAWRDDEENEKEFVEFIEILDDENDDDDEDEEDEENEKGADTTGERAIEVLSSSPCVLSSPRILPSTRVPCMPRVSSTSRILSAPRPVAVQPTRRVSMHPSPVEQSMWMRDNGSFVPASAREGTRNPRLVPGPIATQSDGGQWYMLQPVQRVPPRLHVVAPYPRPRDQAWRPYQEYVNLVSSSPPRSPPPQSGRATAA